MPLSQKEIRDRAYQFANKWATVTRERAEAQTFWNEFFNIFGFNRRRRVNVCTSVATLPRFL